MSSNSCLNSIQEGVISAGRSGISLLCASFYPLEVKDGFEPMTVFFADAEAQQSSLLNELVYLDKVVANFAASEAT